MDSQTTIDSVRLLMEKNRRMTDISQFTVPSGGLYPFQWLWDSCFHAIVLAHFDIELAKQEMRAVLARPLPSGMLPHMIYWTKEGTMVPNWGRESRGETINSSWKTSGSSSLTQPPVVAQTVLRLYEADGDEQFATDTYEALKRHFEYLHLDRTFNNDSLVYIINPDESGEDNSPRFDELLGLSFVQTADQSLDRRIDLMKKNSVCDFRAKTCMKNYFGVADVSFNVLYAEDLLALSELAYVLNNKADSDRFEKRAKQVQKEIKEQLKYGDVYLSYDHKNKKPIEVLTWDIFMPLYGGLLSHQDAKELVKDYLFNEQLFMSEFGVVSTAKTEPSYDPVNGFWRGPIWLVPHWFIYKGLQRYGFKTEAGIIKEKTLALLAKSGFREHYHPVTGEGLGAEDFTWGGLVVDMN